MRRLLPLVLALLGLAVGLGAGIALQPEPEDPPTVTAEDDTPAAEPPRYRPAPAETEVLRLPSQFLIPLISGGQVQAMVIVGLALELLPDHPIDLSRHEPRLRAMVLQLLFDHANDGGFDGVFTRGEQLLDLRRVLTEALRAEFGESVHDVLIIDLVRQDSP